MDIVLFSKSTNEKIIKEVLLYLWQTKPEIEKMKYSIFLFKQASGYI